MLSIFYQQSEIPKFHDDNEILNDIEIRDKRISVINSLRLCLKSSSCSLFSISEKKSFCHDKIK